MLFDGINLPTERKSGEKENNSHPLWSPRRGHEAYRNLPFEEPPLKYLIVPLESILTMKTRRERPLQSSTVTL